MGIALLTLAAVGTLALLATTVLSYLPQAGPGWIRQHFLLGLGSTFLLVMAHSFIMFFLLATGVELKDMERERGWGDSFRRRTVAMKSRVFPLMTSALLLVIVNFMMGAAAHTRAVPGWVHQAIAWGTLAVCLGALRREYLALGENNRLIAEAASRREDTFRSAEP
ncbi:MAG TPA: hypothetical protein VMT87_17515 [Vicinamibacteria bacterium]|nr:hypothetical protein [Vicinamibacteria bacterium]